MPGLREAIAERGARNAPQAFAVRNRSDGCCFLRKGTGRGMGLMAGEGGGTVLEATFGHVAFAVLLRS